MSDSVTLLDRIAAAEDAFSYADGQPTFEPEVNSGPDASDGEVTIQKACRLLSVAEIIDEYGAYYGAILEHSFIVIEHTLQGYLLAMSGIEASELRNHDSSYELAKGRVPLGDDTIDSLKTLYDARRTEHYYGTMVTTAEQATAMRAVANAVHEHIVAFDPRPRTVLSLLGLRIVR